jgi:hypothetical protein
LDPLPEGNLANFPFAAISIRILFYNATNQELGVFSYIFLFDSQFPPPGEKCAKIVRRQWKEKYCRFFLMRHDGVGARISKSGV